MTAGRTTKQILEVPLVLQLFMGEVHHCVGFAVVRRQPDSVRLPICCCEFEYPVSLATAFLLLPRAQVLLILLHCSVPKRELLLLCGSSLFGTVAPICNTDCQVLQ